MLKSLKWLLVLPVAVLAMLAMQLFCGFIAYDLGDSCPLNLIGGRWIAEFFMSVSASAAFVRGGCWMAPSHRTIVAFLLAALMATLASLVNPRRRVLARFLTRCHSRLAPSIRSQTPDIACLVATINGCDLGPFPPSLPRSKYAKST